MPISATCLHNGFSDFYYQHSKSDGDYSRDIIFRDAIEFGVAAFRTQTCAGTVTAIRGIPCIDIDYTDPRVLAGNFTAAEESAFLFGVATGNTVYKQDTGRRLVRWRLVPVPGGRAKFALGGQWRRDAIRDVPGEAVDPDLMNNIWGSTTAGITAGHENTKELSAKSKFRCSATFPGAQNLTFNGAARVTSAEAGSIADGLTEENNGNWTYKVAGNWSPTNWLRLRATYGTSFRSPALFEEFLANESASSPSHVDPCIRWALSDNQEIRRTAPRRAFPDDYTRAPGRRARPSREAASASRARRRRRP